MYTKSSSILAALKAATSSCRWRVSRVIAEALVATLGEAAAAEIDRRRINLPNPIRSVGTHEYTVHLRPDLTVAGSVEVLAQT